MRFFLFACCTVLASTFVLSNACAQQSPAGVLRRLDGSRLTVSEAERIADEELKQNKVMGAQIAILNGGRVVWTHAYGLRDAGKALPMNIDTNIWAASITKSVFGTWVMLQVERGKVDLDEPVVHMLPKPLNEYDTYKESAADLIKDPQWPLLTPRVLLAHSSGLANFAWLEPDKKMHLHFKPGTAFAYSGDGLNLLQFALEAKLGEKLGDAIQRDLFAPLGMTRTGMAWREEFADNVAARYDSRGKFLANTRRNRAGAAGSMATTVHDLAAFTEALLAGKILKPAARGKLFSPQVAIRAAHEFPTFDEDTSEEGPAVGLAYGLGWGLLTKTKYGPAFFKEGHGDGAENYMICFEKSRSCMILLTNSDNGELAFRPLLEKLLGDTVTPWVWEAYTREQVLANEEHAPAK